MDVENVLKLREDGFIINNGVMVTPDEIMSLGRNDVMNFLNCGFIDLKDSDVYFKSLVLFTIRYSKLLLSIDIPVEFSSSQYYFEKNIKSLISRLGLSSSNDDSSLVESKLVFDTSQTGFFWNFNFVIDATADYNEDVFDIYVTDENLINEFNMDDLLISEIFNSSVLGLNLEKIGIIHIIRIVDGVLFLNLRGKSREISLDEREGDILKLRRSLDSAAFEDAEKALLNQ